MPMVGAGTGPSQSDFGANLSSTKSLELWGGELAEEDIMRKFFGNVVWFFWTLYLIGGYVYIVLRYGHEEFPEEFQDFPARA
jgi:hypothetical protein